MFGTAGQRMKLGRLLLKAVTRLALKLVHQVLSLGSSSLMYLPRWSPAKIQQALSMNWAELPEGQVVFAGLGGGEAVLVMEPVVAAQFRALDEFRIDFQGVGEASELAEEGGAAQLVVERGFLDGLLDGT